MNIFRMKLKKKKKKTQTQNQFQCIIAIRKTTVTVETKCTIILILDKYILGLSSNYIVQIVFSPYL